MDKINMDNKSTNLADLANKLEEVKKAIPFLEEKLKNKPKSPESYLICKDSTVAETDQTGDKKGWQTIKGTLG